MGKRSAVVELFLGDMGSIQRELRPSTQREDQLTMETKLEQIAVKAVNQLPKSVVREIRTPRSVGAGGGRPPPATRWARGNSRPYRESDRHTAKVTQLTQQRHWLARPAAHAAIEERWGRLVDGADKSVSRSFASRLGKTEGKDASGRWKVNAFRRSMEQ